MSLYSGSEYRISSQESNLSINEFKQIKKLFLLKTDNIDLTITEDTDSAFTIKLSGTCGKGINTILKDVLPDTTPWNLGLRLTRLKTYCKDPEGVTEDFFSLSVGFPIFSADSRVHP